MGCGNSITSIILIIIALFILVQIYNSNKYMAVQNEINTKTTQTIQQSQTQQPSHDENTQNVIVPPPTTINNYEGPSMISHPVDINQIVKEYDYRNVRDILVPPVKRPSSSLVTPIINDPLYNIHTRGHPHNYSWMGILINTTETSEEAPFSQDNKIVKLFGRQKYPNSTQYQYYVVVNTGNDQTKINLDKEKYRKELYDDDVVTIDELNMTFKVKLNDSNWIEYSPYVI